MSTDTDSSAAAPPLGAHMSIAGGVFTAFARGEEATCDVMQVFTATPNQWAVKEPTLSDVEAWEEAREASPVRPVLAHTNYLANPATPDPALHDRSRESLLGEFRRCRLLEIPYLVLHPGAHMGAGEPTGITHATILIDELLGCTEGWEFPKKLLLENTAGQGTTLGWRFEHLRDLIEASAFPDRLGVCLDTAHVFAAGYDIRTAEGYFGTLDDLEETVGLDRLLALHLNDSAKPCGSRVDRHQHIGKGEMGVAPFRFLMNDERLCNIPMVLETPKGDNGAAADRRNLSLLRSLVQS